MSLYEMRNIRCFQARWPMSRSTTTQWGSLCSSEAGSTNTSWDTSSLTQGCSISPCTSGSLRTTAIGGDVIPDGQSKAIAVRVVGVCGG